MSNCRTCPQRVVTTSVAVVGTSLVLTVPATTVFTIDSKVCLIIAQPLPEAGEALPVVIEVSGTTTEIPLYHTISEIQNSRGCHGFCTFGNIVYGIDLCEVGRNRLPLFFSDASIFYDLRGVERLCRCREV